MKKFRWSVLLLELALLMALLIPPAAGLSAVEDFARPIGKSVVISNDASLDEVDPVVVYNGKAQEYLVVFWNDRPGNDDIRAERVSATGKPLGGFWVSAGAGHDRRHPRVAYNWPDNQYLVVWEDYVQSAGLYTIQGRLVSATGAFVSDEMIQGISISSTPSLPAVAYSSTSDRYLVVWQEVVGTPPTTWESVMGQLVNGDGTLYGSKFYIGQDLGGQPRHRPDIVYNRGRNDFLVIWEQKYWGGTDYDIEGRLVGSDGTVGTPVVMPRSTDEESRPHAAILPTVVSNGDYIVVWQSGGNPEYIYEQLVSGLGTLIGPKHAPVSANAGIYLISNVAANEYSQQFLVTLKSSSNPVWGQGVAYDYSTWSEWYDFDSGPGADHPAAAGGMGGSFLVVFDRSPVATRDIYAQLWGYGVFLPSVMR